MFRAGVARPAPAPTALLRGASVDAIFVALAGWLMVGVFLDAGAHIRRLPDTFWTPWHGVLYSGLLACGAFLVGMRVLEARTGERLLEDGYAISLLGVAIGGIGGLADAVWHTLFGIEFDLDAAVSPSHLLVAAGIVLVVSGPARAAWRRGRGFGIAASLSLLYALSMLTLILDYADPFAMVIGSPRGTSADLIRLQQTEALFAFMTYAALLAGATLLAARAAAPAWAYAVIAGGNAAAMLGPNAPLLGDLAPLLLAVAGAGAVLISVAALWLRPARERPRSVLAMAALVPALMEAEYVVAVASLGPTAWSPTFWCGLVAVGAMTGLLIGALATAHQRSD
jgi:hypothetical protein